MKFKYFPLLYFKDYPNIYNDTIFVGESYGIKYPSIKINGILLPVRKKYKLYKIENDYPRTNFRKNKKYLIQNEWNWDYIISAGKEIKIEFLYYAIDVSQKSEGNKNSNHYGYYSGLEKSTIESLGLPAKATLNLPKGFTAVGEGKVKINGPYNGSINNLEYQHIEIIKNFTQ